MKVKSPSWHRTRSTLWLLVDIVLTAATVTLLVLDGANSFLVQLGLGLVASVAAVVTLVIAILEISRHRRPLSSVINLILSLLINPYTVVGYLVWFGLLDLG